MGKEALHQRALTISGWPSEAGCYEGKWNVV